MASKYYDSTAVINVIGCVFNNPSLLDYTEQYNYMVVYSLDEDLYQKQIKEAYKDLNDETTQKLVEYLLNYTMVESRSE